METPPLSAAEVAEAERELGVSFPAEYRAYLLEVGAGGTVSRLAAPISGQMSLDPAPSR